MRFKRIFVVVAAGLFLSTCVSRTYAQSTGLRTSLDDRGSVPPVHQWFRCVKQLEHKPFEKRSAQECLESLLSHREIERGRITLKHYKNEDLLTFRLESPRLVVTEMDLGVAGEDVEKLRELLAANGNALRSGEPYEMRREGSSWNVLDMLLRSQGRRAGVTRTLHLDYGRKTARITYRIWDGPSANPSRLFHPMRRRVRY